jgi:hypothetical protein
LLAHPQQVWELTLMVDASADCVGAALQQRSSSSSPWQPLAFFSRKLEPAQIKYLAFDQKLFACCAGIRHFRYMLEGGPFTIYTEHKPLTWARWLMVGQPCSSGSCPSWRSLQLISATCLGWTTWWPTHCPGHLPTPPDRIAVPTPPDQIAVRTPPERIAASLYARWLLCLLVQGCWTMLALPRIS